MYLERGVEALECKQCVFLFLGLLFFALFCKFGNITLWLAVVSMFVECFFHKFQWGQKTLKPAQKLECISDIGVEGVLTYSYYVFFLV